MLFPTWLTDLALHREPAASHKSYPECARLICADAASVLPATIAVQALSAPLMHAHGWIMLDNPAGLAAAAVQSVAFDLC